MTGSRLANGMVAGASVGASCTPQKTRPRHCWLAPAKQDTHALDKSVPPSPSPARYHSSCAASYRPYQLHTYQASFLFHDFSHLVQFERPPNLSIPVHKSETDAPVTTHRSLTRTLYPTRLCNSSFVLDYKIPSITILRLTTVDDRFRAS